jgi:predicted GNAT family acetyltransferase
MHILHEEEDGSGRHYITNESGETIAEITYTLKAPNTVVINHTGVDKELQGKNIGFQLVEAVVEQARAEGKKVVPVCSFAKAIIEKTEEFKDVLMKG